MSLAVACYVIALILAILAAIPPLRTYYLLNIALVLVCIGLVISSGAIVI